MGLFGSGKPKPSFGVSLDASVVSSGDTLSGRVWADVPAELKGSHMAVEFYGKEETKVEYTRTETHRDGQGNTHTRTHTEHSYGSRPIFRISLPVDNLAFTASGKIQPGQYILPFQVTLPEFLPSTMDYYRRSSYARISYKVKMALKGSGILWDYKAEAPVRVNSSFIARSVPFDGPPVEQSVKSCCCFGRGSISLGASMENTALAKGQQSVVSYACRNNSRSDVANIHATLIQTAHWMGGGHSETEHRTLHSVTFPIDRNSLKGSKDKEAQGEFNGYAYAGMVAEIRDRVNSASVFLPQNAYNTYHGDIIQITHALQLQVQTDGCCTSNPEVVIPINACDVMKPDASLPIAAQPAVPLGAIPFQADASTVVVAEPVYGSTAGYVYGGAAQSGQGDDDIIFAAAATPVEEPPSLPRLLSKMKEAGVGDRDVVMNLYGKNPSWDKFFASLSPSDFAAIIDQTSSAFDETDVSVFLASEKMNRYGKFSCAHVAAAAVKTEDWNRANLVEKLIPHCVDFKQNNSKIKSVLSDWDQCKLETAFKEQLKK